MNTSEIIKTILDKHPELVLNLAPYDEHIAFNAIINTHYDFTPAEYYAVLHYALFLYARAPHNEHVFADANPDLKAFKSFDKSDMLRRAEGFYYMPEYAENFVKLAQNLVFDLQMFTLRHADNGLAIDIDSLKAHEARIESLYKDCMVLLDIENNNNPLLDIKHIKDYITSCYALAHAQIAVHIIAEIEV